MKGWHLFSGQKRDLYLFSDHKKVCGQQRTEVSLFSSVLAVFPLSLPWSCQLRTSLLSIPSFVFLLSFQDFHIFCRAAKAWFALVSQFLMSPSLPLLSAINKMKIKPFLR